MFSISQVKSELVKSGLSQVKSSQTKLTKLVNLVDWVGCPGRHPSIRGFGPLNFKCGCRGRHPPIRGGWPLKFRCGEANSGRGVARAGDRNTDLPVVAFLSFLVGGCSDVEGITEHLSYIVLWRPTSIRLLDLGGFPGPKWFPKF